MENTRGGGGNGAKSLWKVAAMRAEPAGRQTIRQHESLAGADAPEVGLHCHPLATAGTTSAVGKISHTEDVCSCHAARLVVCQMY